MELRQTLCDNEAKSMPNTLRLMEPKDKKNLSIKSPEINLSVNGQMTFNKGADYSMGKGKSFNKWCWEN